MRTPDGRVRFGLLCMVGYVAIAWAIRHDTAQGPQNASLAYPFDTFSMYSNVSEPIASHLVVRDARGRDTQIREFASYACEDPLDAAACAPGPGGRIEYVDLDAMHYVRSHPGGGPERVTIVRRTWRITADRAPERLEDCAIATCRAAR